MKKTLSTRPALSKLDLLILGLLCGRPMHGYELNQVLSSKEMAWVDISRSSTYKALDRAKKQELVVEMVEQQADKPVKSVFYVTAKGREAFFENLRQLWIQPPKVSFEEHIGVFFLNLLPEEEAADLLERRLDSLKEWQSGESQEPLDHHDKVMNFSTMGFIKERLHKFVDQEINWYGELEAGLRGRSEKPTSVSTPAFSGNLKDFELINIIKLLVDGRRTGTLYLTRNLTVNGLHFKDGHVMGVSKRTGEAEGLGLTAGRQGANHKQEEESSILREVYAAFSSSDGRFSFESSQGRNYLPIRMTTLEFLRAGCREINSWDKVKSLVPSSGIVFDWAIDRSGAIVNLDIADDENAVLSQVNGVRSVNDIVSATGLSQFRVSKVLYVYSQLGAVATVAADRRELFEALKHMVKVMLEGTYAILTKREINRLSAQIAKLINERNLPFEVQSNQLVEKIDEPVDIIAMESLAKTFLMGLLEHLKAQVGEMIVEDLLQVCREQLSPEESEVVARYALM